MSAIPTALADVKARIAAAARRAGRSPEDIALITVTKTRTIEEVEQAVSAGATDLGENYAQELVKKAEALEAQGHDALRWHMIGHLQRNKVKYLAPFCELIHSVDSERLAGEIDRRAQQHDRTQAVLIEVNIAGEESKFGLARDSIAPLVEAVAGLPNVELRGLMTMTPYEIPIDESKRYFAQLRELASSLAPDLPPGAMSQLSMGMTQDFEAAVEEGATMVRVGTAIFGARQGG